MSNHPRAKLVYGIDLGSEDDFEGEMFPLLIEDGLELSEYDYRGGEVPEQALRLYYGTWDRYILGFVIARSPNYGLTPITQGMLAVDPTWDEKIRELATKLGTDITGKIPQWYVATEYG